MITPGIGNLLGYLKIVTPKQDDNETTETESTNDTELLKETGENDGFQKSDNQTVESLKIQIENIKNKLNNLKQPIQPKRKDYTSDKEYKAALNAYKMSYSVYYTQKEMLENKLEILLKDLQKLQNEQKYDYSNYTEPTENPEYDLQEDIDRINEEYNSIQEKLKEEEEGEYKTEYGY